MMNTIVNEELISFKELEQKIYSYVCELAREIKTHVLESYDKELAETRDRKQYRGKGKRSATIKTVYGEVEYSGNVYRTQTADGQTAHAFLPDQAMGQSISAGEVWNMMQRKRNREEARWWERPCLQEWKTAQNSTPKEKLPVGQISYLSGNTKENQ